MKMHIKTGDTVVVLSGSQKGKSGKVLQLIKAKDRAIVEGLNMVKRHYKAGVQGRQAGIVDKEMPMNASKVMPICPSCDKPTRVAIKVLDDGTKSRVCKHCEGMLN